MSKNGLSNPVTQLFSELSQDVVGFRPIIPFTPFVEGIFRMTLKKEAGFDLEIEEVYLRFLADPKEKPPLNEHFHKGRILSRIMGKRSFKHFVKWSHEEAAKNDLSPHGILAFGADIVALACVQEEKEKRKICARLNSAVWMSLRTKQDSVQRQIEVSSLFYPMLRPVRVGVWPIPKGSSKRIWDALLGK